ncbi:MULTISPECIES: CHRD domain-containing protein [unclassified Corallococcus]|uniref:CHRD domain-containing protein n=1 Tax=unclassified Corallococcus TaxID=2685029 RepID=UPI001A8F59D0|nr:MULTISPECIES: CHRD domain-containing protein [unclassified Corallococcus]MBN9686010.1 CHRD domain-containing protein [Corallococcus sp. NCSPR001]WAS82552.1 CHRD domain-containing protein [Corallococcus sp. NCRR]
MRIPLSLTLVLTLGALSSHAKDPALGATTFTVYEAFLSPAQEPGEESETPKPLQKSLGATAPSTPREQRPSRGHGVLRFSKDLTRAYVEVEMTGVNPADILMFHIHCGPPGVLGPVVVDFGESGNLTKTLANGRWSVELTNANVTFIKDMKGMKSGLPESCPAELGFLAQTRTLAGLESLARKGVLYFNLHTKAHTYYGEMRGQLYAVQP